MIIILLPLRVNNLIIDTTSFSDNEIGNAFGVASGAAKHLIERLILNADGRSLSYEIFLADSEFISEPVIVSFQWFYRPDIVASSIACDLEAAGRYLAA